VISIGGWKKSRDFWPCIADQDIERPELRANLADHLGDLFGARHIGLDDQTIGAEPADLRERVVRSTLILIVMDRNLGPVLRQFQRNSSTNPARSSSDQRMFSCERHVNLLGWSV
jgi:hypothetical protein